MRRIDALLSISSWRTPGDAGLMSWSSGDSIDSGGNLRHLVTLLDDLQAVGVAFVSLGEGIDATTPAGRLQMHLLAAIAEFERERIRERVLAGLQRARAQGTRLGRPRSTPLPENATRGLSVSTAAALWGVSKSTAARRLAQGETPVGQTPPVGG